MSNLKELEKKAEQDRDVETQFQLGYLYFNSKPRNLQKAIYWYSLVAELGFPVAENNLGLCYQQEGPTQNLEKAIRLYRSSAEKGYILAEYNLGFCYNKGIGVEKNKEVAMQWFEKAAEKDHPEAQNDLAWAYQHGPKKDIEKAIYWYKRACNNGSTLAMGNLAWCYLEGVGVEINHVLVVQLYSKAAELGDPNGQYNMGILYKEGKVVKKNITTSIYWLEKAANQGHVLAKNMLIQLMSERLNNQFLDSFMVSLAISTFKKID